MLGKLQRFIIEEDLSLKKLEVFLSEPNYFEILGISHKELQHSNFLAWLLNPKGSHMIGNYFLKKFINLLEIAPNDKIRMNLSNLTDTIIRREYKNIDLLIINNNLNFTICIENKIYADKSGENQLTRYHNLVESMWSGKKNYYVYLTSYPRDLTEEESEKGYVNITYREILDIIQDTAKYSPPSKDTESLVANYIKNLKKNIMKESDEILLAQEIYRKHKSVINFIINNKPNLGSLFKKISNYLSANEKYENLTPTDDRIIRFLPKSIVSVFDYEKSWGNLTHPTAFALEIFCESDVIWVKFCFGALWGENQDIKQQKKDSYFSTMNKFTSLSGINTQSKSSSKWVAVAKEKIMSTNDDEIFEHEDLYTAFLEKFKQFEKRTLEPWTKEVKEKIIKN